MPSGGMGRLRQLALALVLVGAGMAPAYGQLAAPVVPSVPPATAQNEGTVRDIRVEGAERIEPATVKSYMSIRAGDPFDPVQMDKSLKSLFATGLFADVTLRREGDTLVVRVVENPIINRVAFEGNKRIEDKDLEKEIQLRPRVVFTRSRVQRDVQRIIDIYRRSGRFAVTVDPKIIQLPQNRVDLVFEIHEGPLTEIRRITFIGNHAFSDSTLRDQIQTKESAWYRFLFSTDVYDPDRLTFDRELLRRFYLKNGYADFRVVSAVAELDPSRTAFYITFTIDEGERYRFGKINVESHLRNLKADVLRPSVTVEQGDWYNADEVENTINALTDEVGTRGYAFVDIRPKVRRDRAKRTVDVTFDVQEGPRVFVQRIDIQGNLRTQDRVIRREMRLVEGDAFNSARLRQSRRNIQNLNFFDKVEVTNVPGSAPDRTVIKVDVREKSTGEVSFGAGVSTTAGLLGDIGIRERNLLGRGQDVKLNFQLGQFLQSIEGSFTEPYFLDRPLSAGFDLFDTKQDFQDQASFDKSEVGFQLRAGYKLSLNTSQTWRYTLRRDKISNVGAGASEFIQLQAQEGGYNTSLIGTAITYDRRDNKFDPHEGWFISPSADFAGLGGTVHYARAQLSGGYFYPLSKDYTLGVSGQSGYIVPFQGETVRIGDRFFLGGDNLRGFATAGVGPRDLSSANRDALGGDYYYTGTVELSFPLGLPSEFAITGKAFVDAGSIGRSQTSLAGITDTRSLRASAGVGIAWRSPFGPVRVDLAQPFIKESFDVTELVRFSFGTRF